MALITDTRRYFLRRCARAAPEGESFTPGTEGREQRGGNGGNPENAIRPPAFLRGEIARSLARPRPLLTSVGLVERPPDSFELAHGHFLDAATAAAAIRTDGRTRTVKPEMDIIREPN